MWLLFYLITISNSKKFIYECEYSCDYLNYNKETLSFETKILSNPTRAYLKIVKNDLNDTSLCPNFCIKCHAPNSASVGSCLFGSSEGGYVVTALVDNGARVMALNVRGQDPLSKSPKKFISFIVKPENIVDGPETKIPKIEQSNETQSPSGYQFIMLFVHKYWYIILPLTIAYMVAPFLQNMEELNQASETAGS